jgi:hypothetical protein
MLRALRLPAAFRGAPLLTVSPLPIPSIGGIVSRSVFDIVTLVNQFTLRFNRGQSVATEIVAERLPN